MVAPVRYKVVTYTASNKGTHAHVAIADTSSLTLNASNPAIGDFIEFIM